MLITEAKKIVDDNYVLICPYCDKDISLKGSAMQ
jgi:hypothetical protein